MLRVTPMVVHGTINHQTGDCSTGLSSTAGSTITGSVVDRLALGRNFTHVQSFVIGAGLSNTSTGGIKHALLDTFLLHGDSSGGGDLAEIDTGLRTAQQVVHATQLTTDETVWTTGTVRVEHYSNPYSLQGAKRFLAAGTIVGRSGNTTATAEGNTLRIAQGLNFMQADNEPPSHGAIVPDGTVGVLPTTSTAT